MLSETDKSCIQACKTCAKYCMEFASVCFRNKDEVMLERAVRLSCDCARICEEVVRFISMNNGFVTEISLLCADLCESLSKECLKCNKEYCIKLAEVCNACVRECRKLADVSCEYSVQ